MLTHKSRSSHDADDQKISIGQQCLSGGGGGGYSSYTDVHCIEILSIIRSPTYIYHFLKV